MLGGGIGIVLGDARAGGGGSSDHDRNNFADMMTFKILVCFQKLIIIQINNLHLITNS